MPGMGDHAIRVQEHLRMRGILDDLHIVRNAEDLIFHRDSKRHQSPHIQLRQGLDTVLNGLLLVLKGRGHGNHHKRSFVPRFKWVLPFLHPIRIVQNGSGVHDILRRRHNGKIEGFARLNQAQVTLAKEICDILLRREVQGFADRIDFGQVFVEDLVEDLCLDLK